MPLLNGWWHGCFVQSNRATHPVGCIDTLSTVATVSGVCIVRRRMVYCVVYIPVHSPGRCITARNVGVTIHSTMAQLQWHIILCTLNMIFITAIWCIGLVLSHQQLFHLSTFYRLYRLPEDGQTSGRNIQEAIVNKNYSSSVHFVVITTVLYRVKGQFK